MSKGNLYNYPSFKKLNSDILYYETRMSEGVTHKQTFIDAGTAYKFQGDFYGLMMHLGIPSNLFMMSMYLNNLTSPYAYNGKPGVINIAEPLDMAR